MEIAIRIIRQLIVALVIADIMWITIPKITSREIKNDLPLATKIILLVLMIAVFITTEFL